MAPEGHRPSASGLDPFPAVGRRRRDARPQASQLRPTHSQEDGASRAGFGAVHRASSDRVLVVDTWDFAQPKTKDALKALTALGVEGRTLIVLTLEDEVAWKSFRNVPSVHVLSAGELNAYDILVSDYVIFTKNSVPVGDFTVTRGHKQSPSGSSERVAQSPSNSSEREDEASS